MRTVIGIPARFNSTRFPGKPLHRIAGKPMIVHVIERSLESDVGPVFVATDNQQIADVSKDYGAEVRMTSPDHNSGTERLAEALLDIDCDVVINVQGDEPLIDPKAIHAVLEPFKHDARLSMATLAHPIHDKADMNDPNVVKVICNAKQHAMYFSRSCIPYPRKTSITPLQHVGLYAYRKTFLHIYPTLSACAAEESEQLEQLRVLYHGYSIAVATGDFNSIGVDTPKDIQRVEQLLQKNTRPA